MRKFLSLISLFLICLLLCNKNLFAQSQLSIKNFAVFGGDGTASTIDSTTSGVEFASNINIAGGGSVGTNTFLQFNNFVTVAGNVYGNTARIGNTFTDNPGSIFIYNRQNLKYAVLDEGYAPQYLSPGNITVNGNTVISTQLGGTISGSVTHPNSYTYSGPSPDGGEINTDSTVSIVFPQLPSMPPLTTFPAAGTTPITTTQTITPGSYGAMALAAQQTLRFSGVGVYVFTSIANGLADSLIFDFKNNVTGSIKIYVYGNVDLNSINTFIQNGGDASRIYIENHGTSFLINSTSSIDSHWQGIIFAPNGPVKIGSTNVGSANTFSGCVWSAQKVTIGINTAFTFVPLSSSADPSPNSLILPYYTPPANGKTNTIIGSELTSLFENPGTITNDSIIYRIDGNNVYIEVVTLSEQYGNAYDFLSANGLTNVISSVEGISIISGSFPIANLTLLNSRPDLFKYVRPLYFPLRNSGVATTQGDTAMTSNFVRSGYNLTGKGVKVGVISDSYNTIPGDYAGIDVRNGDLPGAGNPYGNTTPVDVLEEYPLGQSIDEGRAMLQIVHDIAPKAALAFTTGFLNASDFAHGIYNLQSDGCNVIVDDITYITEPYFKDGIIARAVDDATSSGVSYFSAAGNFGKKSYEGTFTGIPAPASISGITGTVHDFGGNNPFQALNLTPGNYTIVLQWDDNFYSLPTSGGIQTDGAQTDLDIFLTDNLGATLFGFNRNNIGNEPVEVLPFTVTANTSANLIISKASGPDVKFKYIVFRGNLTIADYAGSSTLVGQANAAGAIAVGAVLYTNTPPYGLPVPTIASFSSIGGTSVDGIVRNKPELTAPNGVNTTVDFGSVNLEDDHFPNFFGTSAAAPHAAASAALLIEGKKKFLGETITPANLRTLLLTTTIDMGTPGYDDATGYGFIQPLAAMETFASPIPKIDSLVTTTPIVRPVTTNFTVTVKGKGLTPVTQVYLRGVPITTRFVDNQTITADIPAFNDNPSVKLYNPSIIPVANRTDSIDGGFSDSTFFFPTIKQIIVTADNKTKKYGEKLPVFTASITVDGVPIANTSLTPADLKLNNLTYTTPATSSSNVANYFIHPVNPLNPAIPADAALLTQYNYQFVDGLLTVAKLPLKITPRDTTLTYGQRIRGIHYNYIVGPSANLQNPDSLLRSINLTYSSSVIDSIIALVNGSGATSRALVNSDLTNLSIMISSGSGATSRALVNNGSGAAETSYFVDIDVTSIFNYLANPASSPLVNGSGATSRALVNTGPLINGTASVVSNGSGATSRALVNGDPTLLNSNTTGGTSNTNVAVVISNSDVPAATNNIITEKPVNMVTNGIAEGVHTIVPAAFISGNFEISYGLGTLTINRAPLTITANNQYTNNGVLPTFTSTKSGYQFQDPKPPVTGPAYTLSPTYTGKAGVYTIKPSALSFAGDSNYLKNYINGTLYVNPYNTGKKILISVRCVEKVKNGPSGLGYVAHFVAQNSNATPYYVPLGADNFLLGICKYSGTPPVLFPPGTTNFDIYFDGTIITWGLNTYQGKVKCFQLAVATSLCKCSTGKYSLSNNTEIFNEKDLPTKTEIYPNPATDKLMVTSSSAFANEKDVSVVDVKGSVMNVQAVLKSAQTIELNISGLLKGTYFIRIIQKGGIKTLSFIKL